MFFLIDLPDPSHAAGSPEETKNAFRRTRDAIHAKVEGFLSEPRVSEIVRAASAG